MIRRDLEQAWQLGRPPTAGSGKFRWDRSQSARFDVGNRVNARARSSETRCRGSLAKALETITLGTVLLLLSGNINLAAASRAPLAEHLLCHETDRPNRRASQKRTSEMGSHIVAVAPPGTLAILTSRHRGSRSTNRLRPHWQQLSVVERGSLSSAAVPIRSASREVEFDSRS